MAPGHDLHECELAVHHRGYKVGCAEGPTSQGIIPLNLALSGDLLTGSIVPQSALGRCAEIV